MAAQPTQPTDPTSSIDEPAPTRRETIVVYTILAVTILLAILLIVGTGLQWLTQRTPTSIVVLHGKRALTDATLVIKDEENESAPRTVAIPSQADFELPVFLESGNYTLIVKEAGITLIREQRYVAEGSRYDLDVSTLPTTQP